MNKNNDDTIESLTKEEIKEIQDIATCLIHPEKISKENFRKLFPNGVPKIK